MKIEFSQRKLSRIAHFCHAKDATPQNFTEKTLANSYKTVKFTKVFSLESFLLYGTSLDRVCTEEDATPPDIYLTWYVTVQRFAYCKRQTLRRVIRAWARGCQYDCITSRPFFREMWFTDCSRTSTKLARLCYFCNAQLITLIPQTFINWKHHYARCQLQYKSQKFLSHWLTRSSRHSPGTWQGWTFQSDCYYCWQLSLHYQTPGGGGREKVSR